jgi:shikimate kinase
VSDLPVRRIVLVGFMGAGKSTVGRELARQLGWRFLDMDRRIEQDAGLSVAEIFRRHGEPAFRAAEARLAASLADLDRHVVAAGGGAFAAPETRASLQAGAFTVYMRCDFPTLVARVRPDGSRPLAGSRETMAGLFAEREASYRLADWTVDASVARPEQLARRIREAVRGGRIEER